MATTVSQRATFSIVTTEESSSGLGTTRKVHSLLHEGTTGPDFKVYPTGTTAASQQQDKVASATGSLVATTLALDLAGGLTDIEGVAITMVEVTGITIKNKSTVSGEILIVGAGSNPLLNWIKATGDAVHIGPSGILHITSPIDGYAITASTGDILTIDSGAATISYEYIIHGRSA